MGAMDFSDVIALAALGLSVATAIFTWVRTARWDRPVVIVGGLQWIAGSSETPEKRAGFSISITNTGNQATQILEAYWQIDRGDDVTVRYVAKPGGGGIESLFVSSAQPAPELPFKLDRFENREWDFTIPLKGMVDPDKILQARPVVVHTSRKGRETVSGPWQPSQIALDARRNMAADLESDNERPSA